MGYKSFADFNVNLEESNTSFTHKFNTSADLVRLELHSNQGSLQEKRFMFTSKFHSWSNGFI